MRLLLVPMLWFVLAASAHAAQPQPQDLRELAAQQQQLQDDMLAADGKYSGLAPEKRQEVLDRSSELLKLVEGRHSASELTAVERGQVADAVAWIDAALAGPADDKRMVCRYEKATGSHRKTRICRTAADVERERRHSQQHLSGPTACGKGGRGCRGS